MRMIPGASATFCKGLKAREEEASAPEITQHGPDHRREGTYSHKKRTEEIYVCAPMA